MTTEATIREPSQDRECESSLALAKKQRSHVLFVLSDPWAGHESAFITWYQGGYRTSVANMLGILRVRHFEQHEVDIGGGQYPRLPFQYLGIYELSVDGAQDAEMVIDRIVALHREQPTAKAPATWLYYPASEKVGRSPKMQPSMLTLAFANSVPGREAEFREWYATRHIRHALHVPALVSGQCFERTVFQKPGALDAHFSTIAVYEQEGTPESIIQSFATLPETLFHFPMLDLDRQRFTEWVYRPVATVSRDDPGNS